MQYKPLGRTGVKVSAVSLGTATFGVAPLEATSGQVQTRHRLSRGGDRQLNRALHTVMLARAKHHQETKDYIAHRAGEGKSKREAMRCLKRCYARHLFRLLEAAPMTA